jgi:hypothetical protein
VPWHSRVPPHGQSAQYQVLLVEVTGTRLTDYEWYRAASLGLAPWPKAPDGEPVLYVPSAPGFTVNVIVRHAVRGSGKPAVREFELRGCGVGVPTLKEAGLIFIAPDGGVGTVWASQPQYSSWLRELGLAADEP